MDFMAVESSASFGNWRQQERPSRACQVMQARLLPSHHFLHEHQTSSKRRGAPLQSKAGSCSANVTPTNVVAIFHNLRVLP
jgi:hypothetical protein